MIIEFIVISTLLLLLISIILAFSFKGRSANKVNSVEQRNQLNHELYDIRLDEIEQDLVQGKVVDKEAMVTELQYNLLDDIDENKQTVKNAKAWIWLPGVFLLIAGSIAFYSYVGAFSQVAHWQNALDVYPQIQKKLYDSPHTQPSEEELRDLMLGLRTHLEQQPDDAKGWMLYSRLGRVFKDKNIAIGGAEKALLAQPDSVQVKLEYIELALQIGDEFEQVTASNMLNRLLKEQPNNYDAWAIKGFLALQKEDYKQTIAIWRKMLSLVASDSEQATMLNRSINYAQKQLTIQSTAQPQQKQPVSGPTYQVTISVVEQAVIKQGSTLFVYAQAVNGPAMPIAAVKVTVSELPVKVQLSDANAMMQGMKLSDHEQFIIKARVSDDGSVNQRSGQWFGVSEVIQRAQQEPIVIEINQQT